MGNEKVTKRVSLELSPESYKRLNKLKNMIDASSNTEVVNRALHVLEYAVEARRMGRNLQYTGNSGRTIEVVILG